MFNRLLMLIGIEVFFCSSCEVGSGGKLRTIGPSFLKFSGGSNLIDCIHDEQVF